MCIQNGEKKEMKECQITGVHPMHFSGLCNGGSMFTCEDCGKETMEYEDCNGG